MSAAKILSVYLPMFLLGVAIVGGVVVGIVAGTKSWTTYRNLLDESDLTTSTVSTTTGTTTPTPTTTPAPPPSVVPVCSPVTRAAVLYNHTLVLPQNTTFSWNIDGASVVQSYLNDVLIQTDAILSAVLDGDRFLVSEINSRRLSRLDLDGTGLQDIFAWQFDNVYGLILSDGHLYTLTDTNELLRLVIGETYAIISSRITVSEPSTYLTIDPNTQQPYVLMQNGTVGTLSLGTGVVHSVCTPPETYRNIGFNNAGELVGTVENAVDTISLS